MRHVNIPVFIPHLGCPHTCVFCNQRSISGKKSFDIASVDGEIKTALASINKAKAEPETEIAFFGGSFTAIDRGEMIALLETAKRYVDSGVVKSIRLSTRPDYTDGETLDILRRYPVKTIELGIQSLSDRVLAASGRGHTAAQAEKACLAVKAAGFFLVGQMMVGLPLSEPEDELFTASRLCELGVGAARIYPTAVLRGTELQKMTDDGRYTPLSVEEAVLRSRDILEIFASCNIPVIRIGLCASDNLGSERDFYAGAYHPALGELTESALFLKRIKTELLNFTENGDPHGRNITILCPWGATSKIAGQNRRNIAAIQNEFNVNKIKIVETDTIIGYNIKIIPAPLK